MRIILFVSDMLFIVQVSFAQSNLKSIILNKSGTIPSDWATQLQSKGDWECQESYAVKRKKVTPYNIGAAGKIWDFGKSNVTIDPYHLNMNNKKYSDFEVEYFNGYFVISTMVSNAGREFLKKNLYKIINLTDEYLVLEAISDFYCFDFASGRMLTKAECEEKRSNEPARLFGGKSINIGKAGRQVLLFKLKK